tara:strand:- start:1506 stop:1979 length:474 start_codon:yes stop_codon:yes gene_type:complete
MAKGRKKLPTKVKQMQGTLDPSRAVINEMKVDMCQEIPIAPGWLSEIGKEEWYKVTNQLFNLQMLYQIDLQLVAAYCNEISLYIETEIKLRDKGRIQVFKNSDGSIKHAQAVPFQKIAKDALDRAMKLATQFGFTPVARASISAPNITNNTQINYFD